MVRRIRVAARALERALLCDLEREKRSVSPQYASPHTQNIRFVHGAPRLDLSHKNLAGRPAALRIVSIDTRCDVTESSHRSCGLAPEPSEHEGIVITVAGSGGRRGTAGAAWTSEEAAELILNSALRQKPCFPYVFCHTTLRRY